MSDLKFFESSISMGAVSLNVRSTLVTLSSGLKILISPINFSIEQQSEIQKNPPDIIVAPNAFHHLNVPKARSLFPLAKTFASPALQKKRADINWDSYLDESTWPYRDELAILQIQGAPKYSEFLFFHKASKTLIVTDLLFNMKNLTTWKERLIFGLMGTYNKTAVSRLLLLMTKNQASLKASLIKALEFNFDRLVMAHGDIISENGKEHLSAALKERGLL